MMDLQRKVLVVTLEFDCAASELEDEAVRVADPIANVPGLIWKLWLANPGVRSAGGGYLFESEGALHVFVDGPIAAEINNRPEFRRVKMRVFDVMELPSRMTRAPLGAMPDERDCNDHTKCHSER